MPENCTTNWDSGGSCIHFGCLGNCNASLWRRRRRIRFRGGDASHWRHIGDVWVSSEVQKVFWHPKKWPKSSLKEDKTNVHQDRLVLSVCVSPCIICSSCFYQNAIKIKEILIKPTAFAWMSVGPFVKIWSSILILLRAKGTPF